MAEKLIDVEILQSTWDGEHWAICFDGTRVAGADAGPWRAWKTFRVPLKEFQKLVQGERG